MILEKKNKIVYLIISTIFFIFALGMFNQSKAADFMVDIVKPGDRRGVYGIYKALVDQKSAWLTAGCQYINR